MCKLANSLTAATALLTVGYKDEVVESTISLPLQTVGT